MSALQRLAEALDVSACRADSEGVVNRGRGFLLLEDSDCVSTTDADECWWRTFDATELRTIAALMLEVADELDAAKAAEVTP